MQLIDSRISPIGQARPQPANAGIRGGCAAVPSPPTHLRLRVRNLLNADRSLMSPTCRSPLSCAFSELDVCSPTVPCRPSSSPHPVSLVLALCETGALRGSASIVPARSCTTYVLWAWVTSSTCIDRQHIFRWISGGLESILSGALFLGAAGWCWGPVLAFPPPASSPSSRRNVHPGSNPDSVLDRKQLSPTTTGSMI